MSVPSHRAGLSALPVPLQVSESPAILRRHRPQDLGRGGAGAGQGRVAASVASEPLTRFARLRDRGRAMVAGQDRYENVSHQVCKPSTTRVAFPLNQYRISRLTLHPSVRLFEVCVNAVLRHLLGLYVGMVRTVPRAVDRHMRVGPGHLCSFPCRLLAAAFAWTLRQHAEGIRIR